MLSVKDSPIESDKPAPKVIDHVKNHVAVTYIVNMMSGNARKSVLVTSCAMKVTTNTGSIWLVTSFGRLVTEEGK